MDNNRVKESIGLWQENSENGSGGGIIFSYGLAVLESTASQEVGFFFLETTFFFLERTS